MIQLPADFSNTRAHLVGTEALERVVGELVTDVDQAVVGVDVVQTVRLGLAGRFAHILAVPEQAVEVELIGVFTVSGQTGITGEDERQNKLML